MKRPHLPRLFQRKPPVPQAEPDMFLSLQKEMNALLDAFSGGWQYAPCEEMGTFTPRINMAETETDIVVTAELPGVQEKDVTVQLVKDMLTITGEKHFEKEENLQGVYSLERAYGSFQRTLPLPCQVDGERTVATTKDGVLTVLMPKLKTEKQTSTTIPIRKG